MVFTRSKPPRKYKQYQSYRPYLRNDFQYRCAYCMRHEFYLGGQEGCCIDHYRPIRGQYGVPELEFEYANLYWVCRGCNEYKADHWPSEQNFQQGFRFIDPCQSDDNHDLHWRVLSDGGLEPLTNAGSFTIKMLRLERQQLRHWRAEMAALQQTAEKIKNKLQQIPLSDRRRALERQLEAIEKWLEPPYFK